MRTPLICALAATLVGCSCPLPPQAGMKSCPDTNGFACFGRTAASQPIEPRPASFKTNSTPREIKSTITAKTERPLSAYARDRARPATPTASAAADTTPANTADSRPPSGAVATSTSRTIQEQVVAATAVAERMTVATAMPAAESKGNNNDRSNHSEAVLRGDAEKIAPASPNNTDLLVALVMVGPEIKSVSGLTNKIIAIDDRHAASSGNVRTAIVAVGAPGVELSQSQTKPINRLVSGEVPAAVLALVSPEAAEGFPEIAGFKIFRIPLSSRH